MSNRAKITREGGSGRGGDEATKESDASVSKFVPRYPFEPQPGEIGMGPDELEAVGEIGKANDTPPQGMVMEFLRLMKKLRARRESMGLSLTDVSKRSGLTRQAIGKLENGLVLNPTLATLYRYGLALDAGITLGVEEIEPEGS